MTSFAERTELTAAERVLIGRPALVTGGGRGIGRAVALRLAACGAPVCLAARSVDQLAATVAEIEGAGGEALAVPCDITAPRAVEELVATTVRELGGLSLLVNNAGGAHRVRPFEQLDAAAFSRGTELNYTAVHRILYAAAPHLLAAAPQAAVVNIVSIAAARGLAGMSHYSGAKAAVVGFTRAVAREWGPRGVRVNCVGPGWIATELTRQLRGDAAFSAETLAQVPLGCWGEPSDVAEAAVFLLSDRASYITGTTLFVDGGLTA